MLDRIIYFSIKNKLAIGIFTLILIAWGIYSLTRLPVDAVPDITNNQVQIITTAPTLASQEVEQFVTYPIERSIANLPDLVEIRSISRFGLSVVTVVFHDNVNIYFARQLINERLKNAEEEIPAGMGSPELAPVSTGLGEIYQYIIHPKKGSEHKYSAMDLRTMHDWIVARQLYGTPGIAEVNSFGGYLKQYEVAIDPNQLKAMNVTVAELLDALEKNNANTGGAYIDKKPYAYFIRGIGIATSTEDIGNIVIKTVKGIPVLVRHVATPRIGHAIRYGAMTRNGEGEVVGGIVMMLKGYNSAEVVERVKLKMETIKKSLPPDIEIEPFLDRTDLVDRAIKTVETNLIEGALIVIFVLVIFLGNLRAGLIVASAIPLSLLFALGMMHVFGVSANLMSLGAIDFGLIVDGAVIIVEATMHHLGLRKSGKALSQGEMDEEVFQSASKIRSSAAFGEIIILIVYIPILTLVGIEGKMFRPMAQTVGFAILGALVLSITYIPMMCALVLPKQLSNRRTFSDKMMDWFQRRYEPILNWAINQKRFIVAVAAALLVFTIIAFSRMGGEFLPQLQEGDYAFHCILPQGASLSQSIETSLQAQRIIKSFPEVKAVIGKTGSAEIPTDPMPPEASDLIIVLKEKKEWTTTYDYNDLAQRILEKLEVIPGIFFEANQPIQMRFNELMTGVRQDVAIKIFGEDIATLADLAPKIASIVQSVEGATAPQIERTSGLPQITIEYNRTQVAAYGLNIAAINRVITAAFAGTKTGVIFENERKFDLVVRLDSAHRTGIEDVANLYIPIPGGSQVPLSQVAKVSFKEGPAQISREDAKRRIVIGFNVKDRDVQSVVKDIQKKLADFRLPTGYYLTYGGTFQSLEEASARLSIAVPIALFLIFALLYFTFQSLQQATLIFTAIPMSAIGGVFALLLRGMPFSISAGVGFIALFGVAVLNGIVLIGTFNQLAKDGVADVIERVRIGTKIRLRPVLMTAAVASLGFLPMALSTGAGAEVQKPLATVVIGGLITATVLTLIVLPLLYIMFTTGIRRRSSPVMVVMLTLSPIFASSQTGRTAAEPTRISFNDAFEIALQNNLQLRSRDIAVQRSRALSGTYFDIPKTGVFFENEDLRPSDHQGILKIGLSQSIDWPGVYKAKRSLLQEQLRAVSYTKQLQALEIKRELQTAYYTLWYHQNRKQVLTTLDSFFHESAKIAQLRAHAGESPGLDSISANARSQEVHLQKRLIDKDIQSQQAILNAILHSDISYLADEMPLSKVPFDLDMQPTADHPALLKQQQEIAIANADVRVARSGLMPDFSGRFFSQRLYGMLNPYSGFSVTVGVPIFGLNGYRNKIRASQLERDYQQTLYDYEKVLLQTRFSQSRLQLQKQLERVEYYEATGLQQAEKIVTAANLAYRGGEISFAELSQYLMQALDIRRNYLDALNEYNQSIIQLNYYLNR
ncbi:CusA/CzcA family heavy metal efflux RND transporter [Polluticoccus soli]|uniref:CusA/CzcA family heavy metal efflux RND transporter n=1 Tax=Polluticoccus soli TaxID=3034150 RepID=UPI0023E1823F|nr:CusA/CzcA family heavy metal efflux RND transporter [Flavipsychrobacter sp. JY13-12]